MPGTCEIESLGFVVRGFLFAASERLGFVVRGLLFAGSVPLHLLTRLLTHPFMPGRVLPRELLELGPA